MWPKYEVSAVWNPKHMCPNALRHDVFCTWEWEKRRERGGRTKRKKTDKKKKKGITRKSMKCRALASAMTLWLFVDTFWMEALEHKKGGIRKKRKRNARFLMDEGVSCYIWMEYSCDKLLSTPKQAASHLRDVTECRVHPHTLKHTLFPCTQCKKNKARTDSKKLFQLGEILSLNVFHWDSATT